MSLDLAIRQPPPQEPLRQPVRAAGPDRVAGAAPPVASPEVGPPNPRMRLDRDLGMVVIEFRDASGRVSTSLPTERELQAYRASLTYGADLPMLLTPISSLKRGYVSVAPTTDKPVAAPAEPTSAAPAQTDLSLEGLRRSA
jgi:hypothetical protein